ncbi:MAG: hypothetical protein PQJ61_09540 [Spirochaetales bacterium]|uniref:Uncharacterized protein n=1 Tax=Candidatus Thalassospirochaeta sargassi TaxID=3119039 RepID=A0AAJ1ICX1_9SPIO|nr:hypothetical protein [Spirochaetales bacterium]
MIRRFFVFVFVFVFVFCGFTIFAENNFIVEFNGITCIPLKEESSFDGFLSDVEISIGYKINNNIFMFNGHYGPESIISTSYRYLFSISPKTNIIPEFGIGTDFHPGESAFSEIFIVGAIQLQYLIIDSWNLYIDIGIKYLSNRLSYDYEQDDYLLIPLGISYKI